jgi:predicted DNA-binding transcriptional regulator YafY
VTPTARLLELLELLQSQTVASGTEIAERLRIDRRTGRRYVSALQELGIPIEGQRGVGGGYRIRPGYRLPPLMLDDDEAVVVALGVVAAGQIGLASSTESVQGALAKIHRVLPDGLRRRVEALESTLDFTSAAPAGAPVTGATVLLLADAIRRRRRLRLTYRSFAGELTRREVSPHGLVVHSGRWYLAAYDHGREDLRTFRVDRMRRAAAANDPAVDPPDGFEPVAYISRSLARTPWRHEVEVLLDLPLEEASRRLPATMAELSEAEDGTLLRMRVSSLDWMARVLAGLECHFTIQRPAELGASVGELADRLLLSIGRPEKSQLEDGGAQRPPSTTRKPHAVPGV